MKTLAAGGSQSCSLLSFRAAGMCLMSEIRNTQEPGGKPTGPLRAKLFTQACRADLHGHPSAEIHFNASPKWFSEQSRGAFHGEKHSNLLRRHR